jgi:hypothetical protein
MPRKKLKPIPDFKTEDEERDFWAAHDATDYFDFTKQVHLDLSKLNPPPSRLPSDCRNPS